MEESKGQILLYQTPDGESRIEVKLQGETVWLTLDQMAELFQRNKSTISRHTKNVFEECELEKRRGYCNIRNNHSAWCHRRKDAESTVAIFATVQTEGNRKEEEREIAYYNLGMIISMGYRIHFNRGVQFPWLGKLVRQHRTNQI